METGPQALLVSSDRQKLESLSKVIDDNGFHVIQALNKTELTHCLHNVNTLNVAVIDLTSNTQNGLELVDRISLRMAGGPLFIIAGHGDVNTVFQSIRKGAYDYLLEPFNQEDLLAGIQRTARLDLRPPLMRARQHFWSREDELNGVLGNSAIMRKSLHLLGVLSRTDLPVLFSGKRGVGKNHLARTAHFLSQRRFQPFIKIDCSGTNQAQLLKLLFGEDESDMGWSFRLRNGALEDADGGTLLLDEVADIPSSIQQRLLEALGHHDIGRSVSDYNIRILSTTRHDLGKLLDTGKLLEDFYMYICGGIIEVPSLRDRPEDIGDLATFFLNQFAQKCKKKARILCEETLVLLREYSWPENVRELRNLLERVVVHTNGEVVQPEEFPGLYIKKSKPKEGVELKLRSLQINSAEEALITQVLAETKGNVSKSASILGISRGTLYSKIKKYGLEKYTKRPDVLV